MPELRFETGIKTYDVNDTCQVRFNPTDFSFIERVFATFDILDKLQNEHEDDRQRDIPPKEFFAKARERGQEMRKCVDDIFKQPVSEAIFEGMDPYAFADGLPVWCNLLFSIMDEIDGTYVQEQERTNPRLAKYAAKYKRRK